jgi:hypothetical protein
MTSQLINSFGSLIVSYGVVLVSFSVQNCQKVSLVNYNAYVRKNHTGSLKLDWILTLIAPKEGSPSESTDT